MASFLRLLPILGLQLLGASSAVVGCSDQLCTAVGCLNSLEMVFDESIPRDYAVTVTIGDRVETADCTVAANPDTAAEIEVALVDASGSATGTTVTCGTERFVVNAAPTEVRVRLEYADGTATNAEAMPAYDEHYANGEECDDVPCRNASIEIDAHAPSGA